MRFKTSNVSNIYLSQNQLIKLLAFLKQNIQIIKTIFYLKRIFLTSTAAFNATICRRLLFVIFLIRQSTIHYHPTS